MASSAGLFLLTWVPWGGYAESSAWYDRVRGNGTMLHPAAMSRTRVPYIPGLTYIIQRNIGESRFIKDGTC